MTLGKITDFLGITSKKSAEESKKEVVANFEPLGEKKAFLSWEAPSRPIYAGITPKLSRTLIIIGAFVGLLLVLMQDFMTIFVIASVLFVVYVLSKAAPEKVKYEISNHGVSYNDRLYYWHELKLFFFSQNKDLTLLVLDTNLGLPTRVFVTIREKDKEKIREILIEHLHFLEEEPKTPFDTWFEGITSKFNF